MRHALAAAVVAICVAVASGCGEQEASSGPGAALNYLPARGAIILALPTDFGSEQFRSFDRRVLRPLFGTPTSRALRTAFEEERLVGSYDEDVKPQLGRDLVIALPTRSLPSFGGVVGALQLKNGDAARAFIERQDVRMEGEANGATLFADRGSREALLALEEDVLVFADSERRLRRALARRDNGNGMSEEGFARRLGDLPQGALIRVFGDLRPLLGLRPLRRLRRIPWVRALRSFAGTATVAEGRLLLDGVLNTDAQRIANDDLPLQPGEEPPPLVRRPRWISGGSTNQSQTTVFLLRAARAAFPRSRFVRDVARVERALGIDFEKEVLRQFDGPSASLLALDGSFAARSAVREPRRLARTIRRLAPDLGRLVQDLEALESEGLSLLLLFAPDAPVSGGVLGASRVKVERVRGERDFYRISGLSGEGPDRIYFGLEKGFFVVGSSERRAKAIAQAPADSLTEVRGASVTHAELASLRRELKEFLGVDLGRLGEMLGSLSASRERLRGRLAIELR